MESSRVLAHSGRLDALREAIAAATGEPGRSEVAPGLLLAVHETFPGLPRPSSAEGCTSHPALILKFVAPEVPQAAAKVVLVPRGRGMEVRTRIELPSGSYRRETLEKALSFLAAIDSALVERSA